MNVNNRITNNNNYSQITSNILYYCNFIYYVIDEVLGRVCHLIFSILCSRL